MWREEGRALLGRALLVQGVMLGVLSLLFLLVYRPLVGWMFSWEHLVGYVYLGALAGGTWAVADLGLSLFAREYRQGAFEYRLTYPDAPWGLLGKRIVMRLLVLLLLWSAFYLVRRGVLALEMGLDPYWRETAEYRALLERWFPLRPVAAWFGLLFTTGLCLGVIRWGTVASVMPGLLLSAFYVIHQMLYPRARFDDFLDLGGLRLLPLVLPAALGFALWSWWHLDLWALHNGRYRPRWRRRYGGGGIRLRSLRWYGVRALAHEVGVGGMALAGGLVLVHALPRALWFAPEGQDTLGLKALVLAGGLLLYALVSTQNLLGREFAEGSLEYLLSWPSGRFALVRRRLLNRVGLLLCGWSAYGLWVARVLPVDSGFWSRNPWVVLLRPGWVLFWALLMGALGLMLAPMRNRNSLALGGLLLLPLAALLALTLVQGLGWSAQGVSLLLLVPVLLALPKARSHWLGMDLQSPEILARRWGRRLLWGNGSLVLLALLFNLLVF